MGEYSDDACRLTERSPSRCEKLPAFLAEKKLAASRDITCLVNFS